MPPILRVDPLGQRWQTHDPFLFCVHHIDNYPAGNDQLGPAAPLGGRNIGQDLGGAVKGFKEGMKSSEADAPAGSGEPPSQVTGRTIDAEVRKEPSTKA